jgi:hypothetical protein
MTQGVRDWKEVLNEVVKRLNVQDEDSVNLWWVLTALRGPDGRKYTFRSDERDVSQANVVTLDDVKKATTAVIRHAIGLKDFVGNGATVMPDNIDYAAARSMGEPAEVVGHHFSQHVVEAFRALGLKWETSNEK